MEWDSPRGVPGEGEGGMQGHQSGAFRNGEALGPGSGGVVRACQGLRCRDIEPMEPVANYGPWELASSVNPGL